MEHERRMKKLRNRKKKRVFRFFLTLFAMFALAIGGYGAYLYKKAENMNAQAFEGLKRGHKSSMREKAVDPKHDNFSMLIMGIDDSKTRKGQYGDAVRTDALMLATFNKKDRSVKLLSIPRDSYAYIPVEKKYDKITHAHAFGGTDATIESVEELLQIPVDYYVKVNFEAFLKIVEALDGIEVDVPVSFTEQNSKDKAGAIHLKKGLQTLDGEQALALARTRHIDSDMERGKRQQLIVEAIVKKATSMSSITKYGDLMDALGSNMKTNFTFGNVISMFDYIKEGKSGLTIDKLQLKGDDSYINGIYYYELDKPELRKTKETLKDHLGLKHLQDTKYTENDEEDMKSSSSSSDNNEDDSE